MTAGLDLTNVPVVDNHCHAVEVEPPADLGDWRSRYSESPHPRMRAHDAADTAFYRRLVHAMVGFHGVADDGGAEAAVVEARARMSAEELTGRLFRAAGLAGLVVDTGYPPADRVLDGRTLQAATGAAQVELLRVELLFQELVAQHGGFDDVVEDLRGRLGDLRSSGFAGLKSIVGYRTGLGVTRWSADDVAAAFSAARQEAGARGAVRLGHQPLLDTLLHVALAAAAEQELPVQFHVGYGDPDVDLRKASPLELREVLEDPAYRGASIVLLHGCWPYVREGAYLAAVYENAYLDLSYAIPYLSVAEMTSMTRAALGTAPFSKLMYSSDGARVPELHWLGAREGRRILGTVLDELVSDGELDLREAEDVGRRVLAENAWRLYGFPGDLR